MQRHPSLDDRFDLAIRIVDYDPAWPVRDFLRAHPDEAREYEALKRRLAAEHPEDRLAYIEGKDTLMAALEQRALTWTRKSVPPWGP